MKLVQIGEDVYRNGRPVYFKEFSEQVVAIFAMTGFGKSLLMRNIVVGIMPRRFLFFDYRGEHKDMQFPNLSDVGLKSYSPGCVSDLKVIEKIAFYISDLNYPAIWESLGASEKGAKILASLAKDTELHDNDIDKFIDILMEYPSSLKEIARFEVVYNLTNVPPLHSATKESVVRDFLGITRLFCSENEVISGRRIRYSREEWQNIVRKNAHILFDFGLSDDSQKTAGQFYVGMLLNYITPILEELNIALFFEEADILFRLHERHDRAPPLCLSTIKKYVFKLQKMGVEIFLIAQNPSNMDDDLQDAHVLILGKLKENERYFEYTKGLRWRREDDYREFLMIEKGGERKVFVPLLSSTEYKKRY